MLGTLLLTALLAQAPVGNNDTATAPMPAPAVAAATPGPSPTPEQRRQAELRALIEKRKNRKAAAHQNRAKAEQEIRQQAQAQAQIAAIQQLRAARLAAQAQQAQAFQAMTDAARQRAATDRLRYIVQSQQAGVPQIVVPGQGMVPYPYGIAAPLPDVVGPFDGGQPVVAPAPGIMAPP